MITKKKWLAVGFACVASLAFAAPKGTVARSTALKYPAHTEQGGIAMGVTLLTAQEVRNDFVSDISRCCLVVEFALYPQKGQPIDVSLDDFSVRTVGADTATKAASAKLISATLQKKAASTKDVAIYPVVGIGYESEPVYDPATGRQRRQGGVYTQAGVGVGVDPSGNQMGTSDADRKVMEVELDEKGLPEGTAAAPIAGYLYFPLSKKAKNAQYELQYMLNGNQVTLKLVD